METEITEDYLARAERDEAVVSLFEEWASYQAELDERKEPSCLEEHVEAERLYEVYKQALDKCEGELRWQAYLESIYPVWQEGWYYLFGLTQDGDWMVYLASPQKSMLRELSKQLEHDQEGWEGSNWEIWADGHKCE